jgi:hypothetical protein
MTGVVTSNSDGTNLTCCSAAWTHVELHLNNYAEL